jgi:hypothetical protein
MMESPSAEVYTGKLLNQLYQLYNEYNKELPIIKAQLEQSSVEVLETFINIEQHRFQQISSVEKALSTHMEGCSRTFREVAMRTLTVLRDEALKNSRDLRLQLKSRMVTIRTEISSIRLPGRVKNYRQESVPVLIDIHR